MLNTRIRMSAESVKALRETLRQAYRAGESGLVKRVSAWLGLSRQESAEAIAQEIGCSVSSSYEWLKKLV